ncbi:hypothetical protein [Spiroplasma endosymbiont of Aspidapion aeneum]|uniref:hypothetical protein n=1 Tax=Spiroplasma endosymbiont of Aspidapion aeneum TaxID=3066276 RepID=UPI00313E47DD
MIGKKLLISICALSLTVATGAVAFSFTHNETPPSNAKKETIGTIDVDYKFSYDPTNKDNPITVNEDGVDYWGQQLKNLVDTIKDKETNSSISNLGISSVGAKLYYKDNMVKESENTNDIPDKEIGPKLWGEMDKFINKKEPTEKFKSTTKFNFILKQFKGDADLFYATSYITWDGDTKSGTNTLNAHILRGFNTYDFFNFKQLASPSLDEISTFKLTTSISFYGNIIPSIEHTDTSYTSQVHLTDDGYTYSWKNVDSYFRKNPDVWVEISSAVLKTTQADISQLQEASDMSLKFHKAIKNNDGTYKLGEEITNRDDNYKDVGSDYGYFYISLNFKNEFKGTYNMLVDTVKTNNPYNLDILKDQKFSGDTTIKVSSTYNISTTFTKNREQHDIKATIDTNWISGAMINKATETKTNLVDSIVSQLKDDSVKKISKVIVTKIETSYKSDNSSVNSDLPSDTITWDKSKSNKTDRNVLSTYLTDAVIAKAKSQEIDKTILPGNEDIDYTRIDDDNVEILPYIRTGEQTSYTTAFDNSNNLKAKYNLMYKSGDEINISNVYSLQIEYSNPFSTIVDDSIKYYNSLIGDFNNNQLLSMFDIESNSKTIEEMKSKLKINNGIVGYKNQIFDSVQKVYTKFFTQAGINLTQKDLLIDGLFLKNHNSNKPEDIDDQFDLQYGYGLKNLNIVTKTTEEDAKNTRSSGDEIYIGVSVNNNLTTNNPIYGITYIPITVFVK